MTDPPTDDTEIREPDAPDPTGSESHTPRHGHAGGVPPDKALSDTSLYLTVTKLRIAFSPNTIPIRAAQAAKQLKKAYRRKKTKTSQHKQEHKRTQRQRRGRVL